MQFYNLLKELQARGERQSTDANLADAVTIPTPLYDPDVTFSLGEEPRHPAVTVSQFAARQYTKWLSLLTGQTFRLPSEAEWEYACRAGTQTVYPFGDDPSQLAEYAWFFDNAAEGYHQVGEKKPNPWGLHDMLGNVAELTLDQYQADAYQARAGRTLDMQQAITPTKSMFPHTTRGGSWSSEAAGARPAARGQTDDWRIEDPNLPKSPWWFTDEAAQCVGFRIVRPLKQPSAEQLVRHWETDNEALQQAVADRLANGRGVLGVVDPSLAEEAKEKEQ
jgi:formylglycine-generating enzyme required for sulfatase activity